MNEKDTIEMTALLIGGTKNRELSPASKKEEREAKRKASEPQFDVSCLEEDSSVPAASEEEMGPMMQWMKRTMKEIKDRKDDISEFEKTMTRMKFEMIGFKTIMSNMFDVFIKIVDES